MCKIVKTHQNTIITSIDSLNKTLSHLIIQRLHYFNTNAWSDTKFIMEVLQVENIFCSKTSSRLFNSCLDNSLQSSRLHLTISLHTQTSDQTTQQGMSQHNQQSNRQTDSRHLKEHLAARHKHSSSLSPIQ